MRLFLASTSSSEVVVFNLHLIESIRSKRSKYHVEILYMTAMTDETVSVYEILLPATLLHLFPKKDERRGVLCILPFLRLSRGIILF